MRALILITGLIVATAAPAAADPCPFQDASKLWRQWRPVSNLLVAVTYRKECGLANKTDLLAIRSLHEAQGCSADTEVGRYFTDRVTAPLNDDTGHPGVQMLRTGAPQAFYRFCEMAEILPWPKDGADFLMLQRADVTRDHLNQYQTFWAHLDAMQIELTHALKEITQ